MFRKKSFSDELFLHLFFESSESDRVFNYLHDSNSIFRAAGIHSETFSGATVSQHIRSSPQAGLVVCALPSGAQGLVEPHSCENGHVHDLCNGPLGGILIRY